jgi:hypothetical protein
MLCGGRARFESPNRDGTIEDTELSFELFGDNPERFPASALMIMYALYTLVLGLLSGFSWHPSFFGISSRLSISHSGGKTRERRE